ncbi:hypothetical protein BRC71_07125 [Halobacteriales archaeon QH_7_65_31]|nr:MAG: hypothetical protein BRC71_07125 [Halobacteriales archaeon QH_7_65_31]
MLRIMFRVIGLIAFSQSDSTANGDTFLAFSSRSITDHRLTLRCGAQSPEWITTKRRRRGMTSIVKGCMSTSLGMQAGRRSFNSDTQRSRRIRE